MSTPTYRRHPAKKEALKLAKLLEIYSIRKVCNDESFYKKKYRRFLTNEIITQAKDCYTSLVKAEYCKNIEKEVDFLENAILCLEALGAQLDVANTLYETPITSLEHWSKQITDTLDSVERWTKIIKK